MNDPEGVPCYQRLGKSLIWLTLVGEGSPSIPKFPSS